MLIFRSIYPALQEFQETKTHVILKGAGGRSFSIGRDMRDVLKNPWEFSKDRFKAEFKSYHLMSTYKKPLVVLMDGVNFGGACVFSMGAKYRIVTERTIISMLETSVGFSGASGASYYLSRLRNNLGIYMALTGFRLRAYDLKKVGLATHFVESNKIKALEKDLIALKSSDDIGKLIANYSVVPMTFDSEFDLYKPKIEECFGASSVEEIHEKLKKDGSTWAKETRKLLNSKSPTSLKVCHRQLYLGKMLKLSDCLKMEYRIALQHLLLDSDIREGCRAILYDKNEPNWNPQTLEHVTKERVDKFFEPLPDQDELDIQ